jgi:hypothetical protein
MKCVEARLILFCRKTKSLKTIRIAMREYYGYSLSYVHQILYDLYHTGKLSKKGNGKEIYYLSRKDAIMEALKFAIDNTDERRDRVMVKERQKNLMIFTEHNNKIQSGQP